MKSLKITLIIIILAAILTSFSFAQEEDEATTSSDVDPKEVLEKVKERVKGNTSEDQIYSRSGIIKQISEDTLVLENGEEPARIKVATDAAILKFTPGIGRSEITLKEIEAEQFLIAIGFQSKTGNNLFAKRLIISPAPSPPPPRKLLTGKVAEIDGSTITVSNINGEKELTYNSDVTVLNIQGVEEPALEDIVVDDDIAVVYSIDTETQEIDTVENILVLPGEANPESEENVVE
jgi:hypothetical protein